MPSRALTAIFVERVKPPTQGQADYFDRAYPGLTLRVSYHGTKSWSYVYRLHGKQRRMSLGRWPEMTLAEARDGWRDARKLVAQGESPTTSRPADSFTAVFTEWMQRDQSGNRSAAEVQRAIERDVLPAWRDRPVASIRRPDIIRVIDAVADRAPIQARRVHAYLHRLFRWCIGRGLLELNPMSDLPRAGAEVRRDRALSADELAAVWRAAEHIAHPYGAALKLLVLTGARRDEITSLRWSEIHDDEIRLPGARTKSGQSHTIPLTPLALDILAAMPRIGHGDFIFTLNGRKPVDAWSRAKRALDAAAAREHGRPLLPWRLHDLRRTLATGMQRLGVSLQVIEAILGHVGSRRGIVGVYQTHGFELEKRVALEKWGDEVAKHSRA